MNSGVVLYSGAESVLKKFQIQDKHSDTAVPCWFRCYCFLKRRYLYYGNIECYTDFVKKNYLIASVTFVVIFLSCSTAKCDEADTFSGTIDEPAELAIFRSAYPDVHFKSTYDESSADWLITIDVDSRTAELYWAGGRFLPAAQLENKDTYWTLLYHYAYDVPDPANFSAEEIQRIRNFSSPENRQNGAGTPPFFYDVVYDCATQQSVERHIVRHTFLGKSCNIHKRLQEPLNRVERRIRTLAETDSETAAFVAELSKTDGYVWRAIRDSSRRSFHSIGIAIDVLPRGWGQKNLYWAWRRDIDPDNWMLLPLEKRWMPPQAVIAIFESEGFIWGGKWIIWDNMHFEYHPELIAYRAYTER
ncbi:MAG: M15 family metallopeptidase [Treponema sp.]|nr:M15 family metallopeptidase [Treponema sp.]